MNSSTRLIRVIAAAALASLGSGGALADATWNLGTCASGSGSYVCTGTDANVTVKAYTSTGSNTAFTGASFNDQTTYIGIWSGNENTVPNTTADSSSPHHAIDNFISYGNAYEMVHLQFTKAVDLNSIVATWANPTNGNGDFQVFRWNYDQANPNPGIGSLKPDQLPTNGSPMNGWQLVKFGDFEVNYTQSITDGVYYSSHWLVSTKIGGSDDAFKLGTLYAANVCLTSVTTGGACTPQGGGGVPEPTTLAMVLLAGAGTAVMRRRRRR